MKEFYRVLNKMSKSYTKFNKFKSRSLIKLNLEIPVRLMKRWRIYLVISSTAVNIHNPISRNRFFFFFPAVFTPSFLHNKVTTNFFMCRRKHSVYLLRFKPLLCSTHRTAMRFKVTAKWSAILRNENRTDALTSDTWNRLFRFVQWYWRV